MTSRQRDDVTLTNILKQVDTLEREIRDLGREAQKGEQFVKNLEEVIDRSVREAFIKKNHFLIDIRQ